MVEQKAIMAVILSKFICESEFGGALSQEHRKVILRSANAALAKPIKGEDLPKGTRLLKVYATSSTGPRRIVYLLEVEGGDLFLLFYRDKKDEIGRNITIKNKAFQTHLSKHLKALLQDLEHNRYEVIDS